MEEKKENVRKKVLVIDDDQGTLELLKGILEKAGYAVLFAKDGQEGLSKVSQEKPQLIILDVLMPTLDGFGFLKELKKDKEASRIPVVILTVRKNMEDSFLAMGADVFIPKPVDTEDFLAQISALSLRPPPLSTKQEVAGTAPPLSKNEDKKGH